MRLAGFDALQDDKRDLARGPPSVLVKGREDVSVLLVKALVLPSLGDVRARFEALSAGFHHHLRVSDEVVEPGGMRRSAALRADDHQVVSVARIGERVLTQLARLGALGGEDQNVAALEGAGGCLAAMGAQVLDQLAVEIFKAHGRFIPSRWNAHSRAL